MPDLDEELIARAIRWCADAGRHASAAQVRAALSPLSWDELLQVRAILADPPPSRPLGPSALADLGRGALPETAAERERSGQYAPEDDLGVAAPPDAAPPPEERPGRPTSDTRRGRGAAAPIIHRARDRVAADPGAAPDRRPLLETLLESEGRATLERLVRKHGARRAPVLRALAEGWRRGDGAAPESADLDRLLQAHGLARGFERRERDELLHALRAAGGVLKAAAIRLGTSADAFAASLARLDAAAEAEEIRDVHRTDVRRRATLTERVRLLLTDPERLADLGLLRELEDDLRTRIPEHVRALRASGASPLATALTQTLAMGPRELPVLLDRLGLTLGDTVPAEHSVPARRPALGRPRGARTTPAWTTRTERKGGPSAARSGGTRAGSPRSGASPRPPVGARQPPRSTEPRRGPSGRSAAAPRGHAEAKVAPASRGRFARGAAGVSPRPHRTGTSSAVRPGRPSAPRPSGPRPSGPRRPRTPRAPSPPRGGKRSK